MKKLIAMLLVLAMVACLFAGCGEQKEAGQPADGAQTESADGSDYEAIAAKGKMIVGITEFAPMDYKDENGEWTGFDAELARMVAEELGIECEFIVIDWDNKILELENGSIDCVWNGMTLNDEVLSSMECTDPYVLNAQVVVMDQDRVAEYPDVDSMLDLTVAVEAGSAGDTTASDSGFTNITQLTAQSDALLEVASGSADACVIDKTMAEAMTGEGTSYENLVIAQELTNEEYGIGFRKGSDMAKKVNDILNTMKEDGRLQELADKYALSLAS